MVAMFPLAQAHRVVPPSVINHSYYPQRRSVCFCSPSPTISYSSKLSASTLCRRKVNATYAKRECNEEQKQESEEQQEEEEYRVLTALRSMYNDIVILDTSKSRVLLLDSTHNIHSIVNKDCKWTGSYWDDFATLPPIVPEGPIAILGLGGGTAAHLMLDLWPSLQLEGWEIDDILIDKAREYLGLSDLENHTEAGGVLKVYIGDALSSSGNISGGYAGIIVDLFSDGKVLEQMQEVTTWLGLNDRLMPNGRLMVNCGGAGGESGIMNGDIHPKSVDATWIQNSTIKTLSKAFPGNLCWKRLPNPQGENYLALTGPLPDLTTWSTLVPVHLSENVKQWKLVEQTACY